MHHILTGTPGAGKTTLIQALGAQGFKTVSEAATDVIASLQKAGIDRPWENPNFITCIVDLQRKRQGGILDESPVFFDRSPVCTYALCLYLGFNPSAALMDAIQAMGDRVFSRDVFFVENLGFIQETAARKITFEEALKFEDLHREAYRKFGYRLISVSKNSVADRVDFLLKTVGIS